MDHGHANAVGATGLWSDAAGESVPLHVMMSINGTLIGDGVHDMSPTAHYTNVTDAEWISAKNAADGSK
jgi:hypothetical protein